MLETAQTQSPMSKEDYRREVTPLKEKLSSLQHCVKDNHLPVIVIFEGWSAAGKGSVLSDVILTLDPRNFKAHSTLAPTVEEQRKPFLWRHWNNLPERGIMGLYDKSWYPEVISGAADTALTEQRLHSINLFERQLADDGALIVKFFLHIDQKEQKKRIGKLVAKKTTAWRVSKSDLNQNTHYNRHFKVYDKSLQVTSSEWAPWHVISGQDRRAALANVYRILVESIEKALEEQAAAKKTLAKDFGPLGGGDFTLLQMPALSEVHLQDKALHSNDYKIQLDKLNKRLKKLHNEIYLRKIPVVISYEGWDAAGKGGNIRRLASALDPRGYEVVPIASPTPPEKAHQHLWRFWTHLPKDGHITIFDRTWYGRVMVERVEGFATEEAWRRSYREINEFEANLHDWGAIVLKFWLHISKEEQLRRFESRQNTPEKQWKITEEDWRNREKWDAYEVAVNDMLRLTSTDFAPWVIIESENKQYGRIKAMEALIEAIETRL